RASRPPALPSFPTRRSSDLIRAPAGSAGRWLSAGRPRSRRGRPRERLRVGRAVSAEVGVAALDVAGGVVDEGRGADGDVGDVRGDRKSTRLNSSHVKISYAV